MHSQRDNVSTVLKGYNGLVPEVLPKSRKAIRRLVKRNRGAATAIAERAGVTIQSVSIWLAGRMNSANIALAAELVLYDIKRRTGK